MSDTCKLVAVIDDDDDLRAALVQALEIEGLRAAGYADGEAALAAIHADFAGVVVTDLRMPGLDGAALFARLHERDPDLPVLVITGHGDLPTAVDLMRRGVYDFVSKPFASNRLLPTVRRALEKRTLVLENRALRAAAEQAGDPGWIGTSQFAEMMRGTIRHLADAERPVLMLGETGTGKSHAARLLHRLSSRARQPLVEIDCASLPAGEEAAFLFGHASGAFPGASLLRTGALRQAQRGTVVLDRIDRLPAALAAPLARTLETRTVLPVGSDIPVPLEAAVVAAGEADLLQRVEAGDFDRALYHRLAGFSLALPPLRDRREDVSAMFGAFLHDAAQRAGVPVPTLSASALARLHTHDWAGNVRELMAHADETVLGVMRVDASPAPECADLRSSVARFEAESIRAALEHAQGDIETARLALGLPRKTLYDKLARHQIVPAEFRRR